MGGKLKRKVAPRAPRTGTSILLREDERALFSRAAYLDGRSLAAFLRQAAIEKVDAMRAAGKKI